MTRADACALDSADPLAFARQRFAIPDGLIYLDGNSLGALPVATAARVDRLIREQWGEYLIAGWTKDGWIDAPARVAAKLAPIVGAKPSELVIADSTSVCLFKLMSAAVRARPGRRVILTEHGNFPTDLYVAEGLAEMLGLELRRVDPKDVAGAIDDSTAIVTLTHVNYKSSARYDMHSINEAAHAAGALTVWDLSHSAGAVELKLSDERCDMAVGCGYKYLNGGPGAPAFIYVAESLQDELCSPLQGWMGHLDPFAFEDRYRPVAGMTRFLTGTPSVLAIAALESGLDSFDGIAMSDVEAKGRALSKLFVDEVERRCGDEVRLIGPFGSDPRGSHVSFACRYGYALVQALIERGIVGDFRAPDLIRFGFAPLYIGFEEAWSAAEAIGRVLSSREWDQPRFRERRKVT